MIPCQDMKQRVYFLMANYIHESSDHTEIKLISGLDVHTCAKIKNLYQFCTGHHSLSFAFSRNSKQHPNSQG